MKNYDADEWIKLMFAFSICLVLIIVVIALAYKGGNPTDAAAQVRIEMIKLMYVMIGYIGAKVSTKNNKL